MPEPSDATLLKPTLPAPEESPAAEGRSGGAATPSEVALLEGRPRDPDPAPQLSHGDGGDHGGGDDRDRGDGGRGPRRLCPRCGIYHTIPLIFPGEDGKGLCAICGTDDILGWDTFGNG